MVKVDPRRLSHIRFASPKDGFTFRFARATNGFEMKAPYNLESCEYRLGPASLPNNWMCRDRLDFTFLEKCTAQEEAEGFWDWVIPQQFVRFDQTDPTITGPKHLSTIRRLETSARNGLVVEAVYDTTFQHSVFSGVHEVQTPDFSQIKSLSAFIHDNDKLCYCQYTLQEYTGPDTRRESVPVYAGPTSENGPTYLNRRQLEDLVWVRTEDKVFTAPIRNGSLTAIYPEKAIRLHYSYTGGVLW